MVGQGGRSIFETKLGITPAIVLDQKLTVFFALQNFRIRVVVCEGGSDKKIVLKSWELIIVSKVAFLERLDNVNVLDSKQSLHFGPSESYQEHDDY